MNLHMYHVWKSLIKRWLHEEPCWVPLLYVWTSIKSAKVVKSLVDLAEVLYEQKPNSRFFKEPKLLDNLAFYIANIVPQKAIIPTFKAYLTALDNVFGDNLRLPHIYKVSNYLRLSREYSKYATLTCRFIKLRINERIPGRYLKVLDRIRDDAILLAAIIHPDNYVTERDGFQVRLFRLRVIPTIEQAIEVLSGMGTEYFSNIASTLCWKLYYGRVPKDYRLRYGVSATLIPTLKPHLKTIIDAIKRYDSIITREGVMILSIYVSLFGKGWDRYLPEDYLRASDYYATIPVKLTPSISRFLRKYLSNKDLTFEEALFAFEAVALNSRLIEQIIEAGKEHKLNSQTLRYLARYRDIRNFDIAALAARYHYEEYNFTKAQEVYQQFKTYETIPGLSTQEGSFRIYKLGYKDPRGLFLGDITGCCQHIGAAGQACAIHGHTDPNGAFIVVENTKGAIVAMTWAWRKGPVVVFDSIESTFEHADIDRLFAWYAQCLIGKLGITQVRVGATRNSRIHEKAIYLIVEEDDIIRLDSDIYSDALRKQHVLADILEWNVSKICDLECQIYPDEFVSLSRNLREIINYCEGYPVTLFWDHGYALMRRGEFIDLASKKPMSLSQLKSLVAIYFETFNTREFVARARMSTSYKLLLFAAKKGLIRITHTAQLEEGCVEVTVTQPNSTH